MKLCGSLLVLFASLATPAFAGTFYVNSTRDVLDANLSDGICWTGSLNSDGTQECTLRAALMEANVLYARRPLHRIHLPAGRFNISRAPIPAAVEEFDQARGVISTEAANQNRDFDIQGDVWITGAGIEATIIDGGNGDRVFDIIGTGLPVNITFEHMTITRGSTQGPGACIRNLASRGIVHLLQLVVSNCVSREGIGGGMVNHGAVIMNGVRFRENSALRGGGLDNRSIAQIYDSTFERNTGQISITTPSLGGGILNEQRAQLTLWQSTLTGNSSGAGGGLHNEGNATIVNSTISGNSGRGGGVSYTAFGGAESSLWLSTSTVTNNADLGILYVGAGTLQVRETIIAGNRNRLGTRIENCQGTVTGSLESLEDADTCGLRGTGDLINTDPMLGPLANNGGPTQTHALLPGSPAIDAAGTPNERRDQRGYPRPLFAAGDIGAFEKGFDFTLLIPLDWSILSSIYARADTSFRLELSLVTPGRSSAEIAAARILGVKGTNSQLKVEPSKDGTSLIVSGVFTPPKDQGDTTVMTLEVLPGAEKASQLWIRNITCDCEGKVKKNPPPIIIPSAEKVPQP